jgi:hypothetical protein
MNFSRRADRLRSRPAAAGHGQQVIPLWKNGAPGFESRRDEPEQHQDWWYKNITIPRSRCSCRPPARPRHRGRWWRPGADIVSWCSTPEASSRPNILPASGWTAFALKYRLFREPGSKYTLDNTAEDIRRAMRTVRARAGEVATSTRSASA